MAKEISDQDFAEILKNKAIAGDPVFQHRVGECYRWGTGIEQNQEEAVKWFKLAAGQGHSDAQFHLGYAFHYGEGAAKNFDESVTWYELAAAQEHAIAQNNLALCYEEGNGVTQDYNEAIRLYNLSAAQGFWLASRNLGNLYKVGRGVVKDLETAQKHYEKALGNVKYRGQPAKEADIKDTKDHIADVKALLEEQEKQRLAKAEADAKAARMAARTQVFISYAHADMQETSYVTELRTHLKTMQRTRKIELWDDTHIKSGEKWDERIQEALARAKVVVLMVSADFIASEYVWNKELPHILEAAREEGATILWLLVSACDYEDTDIAAYQAVTPPDRSLAMRRLRAERDEVYTALVKRIKEIFNAA